MAALGQVRQLRRSVGWRPRRTGCDVDPVRHVSQSV